MALTVYGPTFIHEGFTDESNHTRPSTRTRQKAPRPLAESLYASNIMKTLLFVLSVLVTPITLGGNWVQVKDWSVPLKVNPIAIEKILWDYIETKEPNKQIWQKRKS